MQQELPPGQNQQPQQGGGFSIFKVIFYGFILNNIISFFFGGQPNVNSPGFVSNYFRDKEQLELHIKVVQNEAILYDWTESNITYDTDSSNLRKTSFKFDYKTLKNGYPTVLVMVTSTKNDRAFVVKEGELVVMKKNMIVKKKNLLGDEQGLENADQAKTNNGNEIIEINDNNTEISKQLVPSLRPKFYILFVHDTQVYPNNAQLEYLQEKLKFEIETIQVSDSFGNITNRTFFKPSLDMDNFWLKDRDHIQLNSSIPDDQMFEVEFEFQVYGNWKYMFGNSLSGGSSIPKEYDYFGLSEQMNKDKDMDQVKEMIYDNNPIYVGITMVVSVLHSVFEFLAVKNDIQYWRNLDQYTGLSIKTLYSSLIQDIIITLWLFDTQEVFWLILIQSVIGIAVTLWKIIKSSKIIKLSKFPYYNLIAEEKYQNTTKKFDDKAHKWLYIAFIPLLIGYTIYSLYYEEHKGWYSFVLQTLVGFIYVFGFINMFPQIYINYKLKSVEHMQWRTLIYRFLNTIIDDLFAFIITQPWMRRLSCFRDDIIFIIYIYQRFKYRVDPRRTQYGFVNDELVKVDQPQQQQQSGEKNANLEKEKVE